MPPRPSRPIHSLTLLALALCAVGAESPSTPPATDPAGESDLVIVADRHMAERQRRPVSVEVVTADDVRDRGGALNTHDWLRGLPGVAVFSRYGGIDGGVAEVRLRGLPSAYTQVLVDGIPLSDPTGIAGDVNLSYLDPAGLQRVELLKGAQSGLYGNRAIGGVIDLATVRPTAAHHGAGHVGAGSFDTYGIDAQATGPIGRSAGYAAAVSGLTSHGFSSATDTDPGTAGHPRDYEADGVRRLSGRARVEGRPTDGTAIYAAASTIAVNQDYDEFSPDDDRPRYQHRQHRFSAGGEARVGDLWRFTLDAADTLTRRANQTSFGSGGAPAVSDYRGDDLFVHGRARVTPGHGIAVTVGGDARHQRADQADRGGATLWDDRDRLAGASIQGEWSHELVEVSLIGREDRHSRFGSVATGRAAAAVFPAEDVTLRGAVGNGYRAPSLYELFGSADFGFGFLFAGNPALQPETSRSWEAGADWRPRDGVHVAITGFRTGFQRRIEYDFIGSPNTYRNLDGRARTDGIETSSRWTEVVGWPVDAGLHYTLTRSDDGDGDVLAYTARHRGGGSLTVRQSLDSGWSLWEGVQLERTTGFATAGSGGAVVPGYLLAQAAIGASWKNRYEATLRVENVLDEDYVVTPGYATAPLALFLRLGATY